MSKGIIRVYNLNTQLEVLKMQDKNKNEITQMVLTKNEKFLIYKLKGTCKIGFCKLSDGELSHINLENPIENFRIN